MVLVSHDQYFVGRVAKVGGGKGGRVSQSRGSRRVFFLSFFSPRTPAGGDASGSLSLHIFCLFAFLLFYFCRPGYALCIVSSRPTIPVTEVTTRVCGRSDATLGRCTWWAKAR